jgi:hypothetical protein
MNMECFQKTGILSDTDVSFMGKNVTGQGLLPFQEVQDNLENTFK